jgi:uncharacterized protein YuzB (UPF0349 family)
VTLLGLLDKDQVLDLINYFCGSYKGISGVNLNQYAHVATAGSWFCVV